ncbi:hypothetical protein PInf_020301 [Phytophthora infestans]|nr:hypothetical protein PInf_020301 [Phytophthora infestans]
MIQEQIVPWLIALLDHKVLEKYILERVRLANDDTDNTIAPLTFVDLAAIQFVNGSVTGANYSVRDGSTGRLLLNDSGSRSERFPLEEFVFDAQNGVVVQQTSTFLPGFAELRSFCTESCQDRQFLYDHDIECRFGTDYTLLMSDARNLWTAFGYDDNTLWSWPKLNISGSALESGVPPPSALPKTTRRALLLDAFLAQPFETIERCVAVMETVVEAFDSDWSAQEKQLICVDRTGEADVGPNAVYLQLPGLQSMYDKPILFASPPSEEGQSSGKTPLWANSTATERGASMFELVAALEDNAALYRKGKSVVGRLLAVDSSTLMNAWGESVELSGVRVTDGSQFTTAVLTGHGENSAKSVEFPPQKLYFYWGYARRVAQISFDSITTRFGASTMRYVMNWTLLPSGLPSGIVSSSALTSPSLNMSFLYDDLPLTLQSSSSSNASSSVFDVDLQTGVVVHRRLVWQLTAHIGDRHVLDAWHSDLAVGWLPMVWIEEEAGMSATATMTNLSPFTAKTLSLLGFAGGACVIAVGCLLGYISIHRARLIRLLSIVPETLTVNGGGAETRATKDLEDIDSEGVDVVDASTEVIVNRTEMLVTKINSAAVREKRCLQRLHASALATFSQLRVQTSPGRCEVEIQPETDDVGLDASIRFLQSRIASLERSTLLRDSATLLWRANSSAVALDLTREYFLQFVHGYDSEDSERSATTSRFTASVFRPDILCRDFQGLQAYMDQWEKYTTFHRKLTFRLNTARWVDPNEDDPRCAVTVYQW